MSGVLLASCAGSTAERWSGPGAPAAEHSIAWPYPGAHGRCIITAHYLIHTTIADEECRHRLAQVLEGAWSQYHQLAPSVPVTDRPMDCYIFAQRTQWAQFTREHTGTDARIYLQINRGGYTVHDWFAAYYLGESGLYAVVAHEGWHQYLARHFKGRLPPFLEEGMAGLFERVAWDGELPRWKLSSNRARSESLRRAVERGKLWPLEKLITTHAGDVVNRPGDVIEAYYAQSWAFARFLLEAENGRYRPALQQLLSDTAAGTVYDPGGGHQRADRPWYPGGVRPLLEHYLGADLPTIEQSYLRFIRHLPD